MNRSRSIKTLGGLQISNNPRANQADLTNAPELFGDVFGDIGDDEFGDMDEDGDPDLYGDINDSSLSAYKLISGDPNDDEYGDTRAGRFLRRYKSPLLMAGAGTAAYFGGRAIVNAIRKRRSERAMVNRAMHTARTRQTLKMQNVARAYSGKIRRDAKMPFFQLIGAKMNASPIAPTSSFVADMFKNMLDRQNSDTPFEQETILGTLVGSQWQCIGGSTLTNRFYTGLILQIGINQLNAAPGTVFIVKAQLPTINGPLVINATPWIFTIQNNFDVRFLFFPWQIVTNLPLPVLGSYGSAAQITVTVDGLPTASAVNLVVPGSLHPWAVAMRNALI